MLLRERCSGALLPLIELSSVFFDLADQPGTQSQHQHPCAKHQQLRGCADLEIHHQFERGHDQGNHDHFGELLLQAIERLDGEQIPPHGGLILLARIDV